MSLSPRIIEVLTLMKKAEDEQNWEDAELVSGDRVYYLGLERVGPSAVKTLLQLVALRDVSDVKGCRRYVLNDVSRAILLRPEVSQEVTEALNSRRRFTVINNRVEYIE